MSGSLAILTDAAHQLSDVTGFIVSFIAVCISQKKSTLKNSYGYHRADVIGALASIFIIWGLLGWLIAEAVYRIQNPDEINGELMLITACIGLGCNILNMVILNCCCNEKTDVNPVTDMFDSIASAYRPYKSDKKKMAGSRSGSKVLSDSLLE